MCFCLLLFVFVCFLVFLFVFVCFCVFLFAFVCFCLLLHFYQCYKDKMCTSPGNFQMAIKDFNIRGRLKIEIIFCQGVELHH